MGMPRVLVTAGQAKQEEIYATVFPENISTFTSTIEEQNHTQCLQDSHSVQ